MKSNFFKNIFLFTAIGLLSRYSLSAQSNLNPELLKMQENAQLSLSQGDYANAIMLLNQAIHLAPNDVTLRRDLAYTYFLSGKVKKAKEVIDPVVVSDFADEQTFQLAAAIEDALGSYGRAKRLLKRGITKFPHSGLLYNSQGNLYFKNKNAKSAIASWINGIQAEPSYPMNYYNVAKSYHADGEALWSVLYSEIYINLEEHQTRTPEMKKILVESYQKLFSPGENEKLPEFNAGRLSDDGNSGFENTFRKLMIQNATLLRNGINVETLTMLRTRFALNWKNQYSATFSFTLLTYHQKLLQEGYFDAYNQWLFGAYTDSQAFSQWIKQHGKLYADFENWRNRNPLQPASFDPHP